MILNPKGETEMIQNAIGVQTLQNQLYQEVKNLSSKNMAELLNFVSYIKYRDGLKSQVGWATYFCCPPPTFSRSLNSILECLPQRSALYFKKPQV